MKALSIAWKDIQIFLRDRGALIQLLILPLVFIVITSGALGAIGQPKDTRIALPVADEDGGASAATLIAALDAAGGVRVERVAAAEGQALLDENERGHLLLIPAGFSRGLESGQPVSVRLLHHPDASAESSEAVRLVVEGVARDLSLEYQILASLQQLGEMNADAPEEYQAAFSAEALSAQARAQFEQSAARPLITLVQSVPAQSGDEQRESLGNTAMVAVPGFAILFVFLTAQTTARSIHDEKKYGSFRRLVAAPLSKAALLLGKMLPNFVTGLIQMAVIFAFGIWGLRLLGLPAVTAGRDLPGLVLAVVLIALCSTALGLVIAALARTESQISGLSMLLLWVMGIVGGSIIPLFALERFLGPLPKVVPHYWANRALDNLMLRGQTLAQVGPDLLVLLGFTLAFFLVGVWRFDFE